MLTPKDLSSDLWMILNKMTISKLLFDKFWENRVCVLGKGGGCCLPNTFGSY